MRKELIENFIVQPDSNVNDFDQFVLRVFEYQCAHNKILHDFYHSVKHQLTTPFCFLPIEFFKTHEVKTGNFTSEAIFESSSTTGQVTSKHHVASLALYEQVFTSIFHHNYGSPSQYVIFALLPSYLEREGSSLVYMCEKLIQFSGNASSGFYLYNHSELYAELEKAKLAGQKIILLGVTYALLDFAAKYPIDLSGHIIMETGGMKGKRKELTREEVHRELNAAFNTKSIHSEYGMTELLSQAYSTGNGLYKAPPWMKIIITDVYDPFSQLETEKAGRINVIDLANIDSCAFIQTSDLGRFFSDGTFEVLGRIDHSDVRGCNLMIN